MAFCVTYHQLATYNIRNLYGGLPQDIRWRQPTHGQILNPAQRNIELQKRPPGRVDVHLYDYNPDFNIYVPKAPAFRKLNSTYVDEMVRRLTQPMQRGIRHANCVRRDTSPGGVTSARERRRSNSCTPRSRLMKTDTNTMSNRLQRPTTSTRIRNISRTWSGEGSIDEIQMACSKNNRPRSSRLELANLRTREKR